MHLHEIEIEIEIEIISNLNYICHLEYLDNKLSRQKYETALSTSNLKATLLLILLKYGASGRT